VSTRPDITGPVTVESERVEAITGPARRDQLIQACADRLVLDGMAPGPALTYARACWREARPEVIVAPGQVWEQIRQDRTQAAVAKVFGGTRWDTFTIKTVYRYSGMVCNGRGRQMNYLCYLGSHYRLVAWPIEYPACPDTPQPPMPVTQADDPPDDDDGFDPRQIPIIVARKRPDDEPFDAAKWHQSWLPMISAGYRTRYGGKSGTLAYVTLDVIAYLKEHLGDYRAGFDQWRALDWAPNAGGVPVADGVKVPRGMAFFSDLGGCDDTDIDVAAYLGRWLFDRITGDAAREHGGTPAGYEVTLDWGAWMADEIVPQVVGADPREDLPVDHVLAQCPGQLVLLP
jgi:hypothetical protein